MGPVLNHHAFLARYLAPGLSTPAELLERIQHNFAATPPTEWSIGTSGLDMMAFFKFPCRIEASERDFEFAAAILGLEPHVFSGYQTEIEKTRKFTEVLSNINEAHASSSRRLFLVPDDDDEEIPTQPTPIDLSSSPPLRHKRLCEEEVASFVRRVKKPRTILEKCSSINGLVLLAENYTEILKTSAKDDATVQYIAKGWLALTKELAARVPDSDYTPT